MIEIISSEQNSRVKLLRKLYNKKKRRQKGKFVLEGYRITDEALNAEADFDYLFMSPDFYRSEEGQNLEKDFLKSNNKNDLVIVEEKLLSSIADTESPQGVIAVVNEPEFEMKDIFLEGKEMNSLLLLDRIQDPGNMGTIIRTAVAAGIDGIIILKGSVDIYNLKVLRATMGAIFSIPVIKDVELDELFESINSSRKDYRIVSADLSGDLYYHQLAYDYPFIIAIGNEANGLQDQIIENSDYLIKIPILGGIDSLNAAIATGIIVYKAVEKNWE
ncbi:MAG: TrmH family RNA methyltransferase [Halanaerobiales bacterium]